MSTSPDRVATPPSYAGGIVGGFVAATLIWVVVAAGLGLVLSGLLLWPDLLTSVASPDRWTFATFKPVHVRLGMLGFLANGVFAAAYHSVQRLAGRRLAAQPAAWLHLFAWQVLVVSSLFAAISDNHGEVFGLGPPWLRWSLALVWCGPFAASLMGTMARRGGAMLAPALWFQIATLVYVGVSLVVAAIGPADYLSQTINAVLVRWTQTEMLLAGLLPIAFLSIAFWLAPQLTGRPFDNPPMVVIAFWGVVLPVAWLGPGQMHLTPVSEWASTTAMFAGLAMVLPSLAAVSVIGGMIGRGDAINAERPPTDRHARRLLWVATAWFAVVSVDAGLLSIKSFDGWMHFGDWWIAHRHAGTVGVLVTSIFSLVIYLLPRGLGRTSIPGGLVAAAGWTAIVGSVVMIVPLYLAGWIEASGWLSLDETGRLAVPDWTSTLLTVWPMWLARSIGGLIEAAALLLLILTAAIACIRRSNRDVDAAEHPHAADHTWPVRPPQLAGKPVLQLAHRFESLANWHWHRRLQHSVWPFIAGPVISMVLMLLFQFLPAAVASVDQPSASVTEAAEVATVLPPGGTPLEQIGREIYLENSCFNCHSQMVRPLVAETQRFGEFSVTEDIPADDRAWGHRRVGPDLTRVSGRQSSLWHWQHLIDPRSTSEGSVMPAFGYLATIGWAERLDDGSENGDDAANEPLLEARRQSEAVAAEIVSAGGDVRVYLPDGQTMMTFDTALVALIAYLQSLGAGG